MIAGLVIRQLVITAIFVGGIVCAAFGHWSIGIALHGCLLAVLLWGTLRGSSRLFGPLVSECDSGIWLTFDDGPCPKDTPAILDLLDQYQAKATFFVIGEKAARHPELIREIHRRGHQIGNHTWSHPQATFWCHGPFRTYREIIRCQRILTEILGEAPTVFRAPVGHHNLFVHPILRREGLELIGWSSRGYDAVDSSLAKVIDRFHSRTREGCIVLAHECTPIAREVASYLLSLTAEHRWPCGIRGGGRESDNC
ncbi:MAG: polysaccharide deacetylase family protein [Luteolibacter sp.]